MAHASKTTSQSSGVPESTRHATLIAGTLHAAIRLCDNTSSRTENATTLPNEVQQCSDSSQPTCLRSELYKIALL